jgi:hypothetical protein
MEKEEKIAVDIERRTGFLVSLFITATLCFLIDIVYVNNNYRLRGHDRLLLHRIVGDETPLMEEFIKECNVMYRADHWEVKIWDQRKLENFVTENYPQYDTIVSIHSEAVKYLVLYHYGGLFLSNDMECVKTPRELLEYLQWQDTIWLDPYSDPFFLLGPRGHPLWLYAMETIFDGKEWSLQRIVHKWVRTNGGTAAVQPFIVPSTGEKSWRWISARGEFEDSSPTVDITHKVGFLPSSMFDPTMCLSYISHCRNVHCHGVARFQSSYTIRHCL